MQRFLRILFIICFALPILGVALLAYLLVGFHETAAPGQFNKAENGIWMAHTWVEDTHSPSELYAVGEGLQSHDMRHIYVHTGPLESGGTIPEDRYKEATNFLEYMQENFPNLTWYAWLGQIRSQIDLDNEQVRSQVTATARHLTETVGFDGIHYDIEPLRSNDDGFINLLRETRLTIPESELSIATDEWQPRYLTEKMANLLNIEIISYWSGPDFKAAAQYVDQIVVMGYDTWLPTGEWYRWFLEQQVIYLTYILRNSETDLLIGLPSYDGNPDQGSDPAIENIENGLLGIIQGLTNTRSRIENFTGIAIYAEWEMDDNEWATYENLWQPENL